MNICLDSKISFISGYIFTVFAAANFMDILMAAVLGLVGGLFGLAGKDLYSLIKKKILKR
jgi:hypothetical protein